MEFDALFFARAIPAVVFAAVSKGGFASGAAFAATPILALVIPPGLAPGLMLPLLMLMDVATLRPYWRRWDAGAARVLILSGVLGALVWRAVPPEALKLLIGDVALGFVAFQLARRAGSCGCARARWGGGTVLTGRTPGAPLRRRGSAGARPIPPRLPAPHIRGARAPVACCTAGAGLCGCRSACKKILSL